ncbi:MAG: RNA polymerase sigma factor [Phycisphaerales bacterium JB039]
MPETGDAELEALLGKAQAGDRAALVALLEALAPPIRARIEGKIPGAMRASIEADDVMQVTYMEAVSRLGQFKTGGTDGFRAWLSRVAENNLIDAVRALEAAKRPSPRQKVTRAGRDDSAVALIEQLSATGQGTPSRVAARGEAVRFMEQALGALPADYEKVVRMYDLEGRPISEVAAELGRSEGAVYMLRARAHDRLRDQMGPASKFFTHAP